MLFVLLNYLLSLLLFCCAAARIRVRETAAHQPRKESANHRTRGLAASRGEAAHGSGATSTPGRAAQTAGTFLSLPGELWCCVSLVALCAHVHVFCISVWSGLISLLLVALLIPKVLRRWLMSARQSCAQKSSAFRPSASDWRFCLHMVY